MESRRLAGDRADGLGPGRSQHGAGDRLDCAVMVSVLHYLAVFTEALAEIEKGVFTRRPA